MEWFLVLQLWLAGAPGPSIYVPAQSQARCEAMAKDAAVDAVEDKGHRPVFRLTHQCVLVKGA